MSLKGVRMGFGAPTCDGLKWHLRGHLTYQSNAPPKNDPWQRAFDLLLECPPKTFIPSDPPKNGLKAFNMACYMPLDMGPVFL